MVTGTAFCELCTAASALALCTVGVTKGQEIASSSRNIWVLSFHEGTIY